MSIPGMGRATEFGRNYAGPHRVAFIVNEDRAFLTHRAVWAGALAGAGAEVLVIAHDTGRASEIVGLGFQFKNIAVARERFGLMETVVASMKIALALVRYRPNLVFLVQTASYTLGWFSALVLWHTRFIRVAGGVGRALSASEGRRVSSRVVRHCLAISAVLPNVYTLFQLQSDREQFERARLSCADRSAVIPGTGLDTDAWVPDWGSTGKVPTVAFVSRIIEEKGIREFVEAASILRDESIRFVVVGAPDQGVTSAVSAEELEQWVSNGIVEWWGERTDMERVFQQISLLVFPTRHPEGTPKTLIEAASTGVPAIASSQAGCKAVVVDGLTGWICERSNGEEIASVVRAVLSNPAELIRVRQAARERAVENFDLEVVFQRLFEWLRIENRIHSASDFSSVSGSESED